jgi:hypothetical protein
MADGRHQLAMLLGLTDEEYRRQMRATWTEALRLKPGFHRNLELWILGFGWYD